MIRTISKTFGAGETVYFNNAASSFRLLDCTAVLDLIFYKLGSEVGSAGSMMSGFAFEDMEFDRIAITSATAQTVKIGLGSAKMRYDRAAGTVDVNSMPPVTGAVGVNNFPADQGMHIASGAGSAAATPVWMKRLNGNTVNDVSPVSVGVAATALLAADAARIACRFYNDPANTDKIYIGGAGVTTANGVICLAPGQTHFEDDGAGVAWYGISATAAQACRIQTIT